MFQTIKRSWKKHFGLQAITFSVLSASYLMVILGYLISQNGLTLATRWGSEAQMTVYLKDEASEVDLQAIDHFLKTRSEVGQHEFVNKGNAVKEFQKQMEHIAPELSSDPDIEKFLPISYHVSLSKKVLPEEQASVLRTLSSVLRTFKTVEEVSFGENWVDQYASFFNMMRWIGGLCLGVFLFALMFVMGNSIRNSIMHRREEIEILELVGATPFDVRKPFVIEGIFLNGMSVLVALALSSVVFMFVKERLLTHIMFVGVGAQIRFLSLSEIALVFVMSVAIGSLGTYLSVRSINSGWSAAKRVKSA